MIAVNKADSGNEKRAKAAAMEYQHALRLMHPASPNWTPPVLTCSALENTGLDTIWAQIEQHRRKLSASGELAEKRSNQQVDWMWSTVDDRLLTALRGHSAVRSLLPGLEVDVRDGRLPPTLAADRILDAFED